MKTENNYLNDRSELKYQKKLKLFFKKKITGGVIFYTSFILSTRYIIKQNDVTGRQSALKARQELEKYKNSGSSDEEINNENETQEEYSDKVIFNSSEDQEDYFDEIYQHIDEALVSVIQNINDPDKVDPNLARTRKSNVIWTGLKDGEETSMRKKINFEQKAGPTSYATRYIDNSNLSAFLAN
ncbi:hypothetical protein BpHYR1_048873 [Brachionus plicatilis]|uniref:Uncharacterized protein n=1 Tax=Brachionus plicatilis TaxID=10195 RepID=A0A3M7R8I8_BRAPC|nr:hypothetical protein BpHYR1_048873 [Brachionus plicatilis]